MEIIDITPEKGLTPAAARALYYCWMPCRISVYPVLSPSFWFSFALYPSSKLLILYKFVETLWREHRNEQHQQFPETPSENLLIAFDNHWAALSRWLYKARWNKQHKLPRMEREDKKALVLEGEKWLKLLKICLVIKGYEREDEAVSLWEATLFEEKILNLKKFYNPDKYPPINGNKRARKSKLADGRSVDRRWRNNGKTSIKQAFQGRIKMLRKGENPFCPESQPRMHSIIEDALHILKKETSQFDFKKDYWEEFLTAYTKWVNNLDCKGIDFLWAKDGKWYSRFPGTKRGERQVPLSEGKNYLDAVTLTLREFAELSHSLLSPPRNERLWERCNPYPAGVCRVIPLEYFYLETSIQERIERLYFENIS